MSMIRWDPFEDMNELWDQVNRLFAQRLAKDERGTAPTGWAPAVDIIETKDAMLLRFDLSGITAKDIDIRIVDDTLTISGERQPFDAAGGTLLRAERPVGPFQRSFTLGMPIVQEAVTAGYHDGVLEIILPRRAEKAPKQVRVEVSQF